MDTIVFGPDLALGIPVLDQSHRVILDLLGSMNDLPRSAFDEACRQLACEFIEHLREENALMDRISYPGTAVHRKAHDQVLASIESLLRMLANGNEAGARQIVAGLPDWLEAHINTMDLALAVAASSFGR